jgi:ribosomal-protein-alanine N-acetyltransferase
MTQIPYLTTKRLTLRPPTAADLGVYTAFNAVSDFTYGAYRGGKSDTETKALLTSDINHWSRGFGMWLISLADDEVVGGAGLVHPDGWPSHEMTWWLMPDHRRMGYATEASRAVIEFGYGVLGWPQVETYMRDDNFPARQLAERLGGKPVRREVFPDGISRDVFAFSRNQPEGKA